VKIYVVAQCRGVREKNERQGETQFTTKTIKSFVVGGFLEMDFERKFRNLFFRKCCPEVGGGFQRLSAYGKRSIRRNCRGCHRRAHSLCFDSSQLSWVPSSRTLALL
jgi:hypothetical protein